VGSLNTGRKKIPFKLYNFSLFTDCGGGREIRTLEQVAPLLVFKTSAFNRSATPPEFVPLVTDLYWKCLRVGILPKQGINIHTNASNEFLTISLISISKFV
jgi:hypothetical protein